jgi:peptidyl-prolyl cis-trans isomerase C
MAGSTRALVILGLALAACAEPPPPPPIALVYRFEGSLSPSPGPGALVVAEVGEDKIYDRDVAAHARAFGITPRQAVSELIDLTLLAQEARRQGLTDDPDVVDARKRARVLQLLRRTFAAEFDGPEDVPQEDVDIMWARNEVRLHFDHPEVRVVHYFRFLAHKKTATPEEDEAAEAGARELEAKVRANPPRSKQAFLELGKAVAEARKLPHANSAYWTPRKGRAVAAFAEAVFAIPRVGAISPAVKTDWGWDLIYLEQIDPERHWTVQQAKPEIQRRIFPESRSKRFELWLDKMLAGRTIVRHDDNLAKIAVDVPITPAGGQAPAALAVEPGE